MEATQRKERTTKPRLRDEVPVAALLKLIDEAGTAALFGANGLLYGTRQFKRWYDIEDHVNQLLAEASGLDPAALRKRESDIIVDVTSELPRDARGAYLQMTNDLQRHRDTWSTYATEREVALGLHRMLLWHSVWHMISANVGVPSAIRALGAEYNSWGWVLALTLVTPIYFVIEGIRWLRSALARWHLAFKTWRDRPAPARPPAAPKAQPPARQEVEPVPRPRTQPPPLPKRPRATGQLNATALRGSVFGTWLALVVFSWTSILWSALLTLPFGVGLAILGMSLAGAFLVPVWGTLWGFAGMGWAHAATLRQIGFKDVDADHHLSQSVARLAGALVIPPPRVGTMPIANAFAMGKSYSDATISIGEPLMARLKADELEAVIGHELGHVVSGDMRRMMLMRTFQNATVWFAFAQGTKQVVRWGLCLFAELYIQRFSRKREYWADAIGAALTSKEAMIGALRAIASSPAESSFEKAHARFMFHTALRSHPPTADRIAALEQETYISRLPRM
jgi:heat shock protein HtpX